jgi:hypothetical protein
MNKKVIIVHNPIIGECWTKTGIRTFLPRGFFLLIYSLKKPVEKREPRIRIPAGLVEPGWAKLSGEKRLNSNAFGARYARGFPAVF